MTQDRSARAFTAEAPGLSNVLASKVEVSLPIGDPDTREWREFLGIWDTGATNSVITADVAKQCGLKPTGRTKVATAAGEYETPWYMVGLRLPNRVQFPQVRVTEAPLRDADLLIGMDIISRGDFAVSNFEGKTVFTYRWPSLQRIDFVRQRTPSRSMPSVGRNQRCPCGSGKKYKNCCGIAA